MERQFIVLGPADALTAFGGCATEAGFEVDRREIQAFSVEHVALECLRLVFSKEGAAIVASLVMVIKAYLLAKSSRRVTITKLEADRAVVFDARALSDKELKKLLGECREILVDEGSKRSKGLINRSRQLPADTKSKKAELESRKRKRKLGSTSGGSAPFR